MTPETISLILAVPFAFLGLCIVVHDMGVAAEMRRIAKRTRRKQ